jgi:hypothetical protein
MRFEKLTLVTFPPCLLRLAMSPSLTGSPPEAEHDRDCCSVGLRGECRFTRVTEDLIRY